MRYRKLSPTGDYTFGSGQLNFYRDVPEAVGQAVQTRLNLWTGEWFLDSDEGTPYLEGILGKHSQTDANNVIIQRTSGTQGFADITEFSSEIDPNTRAMTVNETIDTIYGPTTVTLQNYVNF